MNAWLLTVALMALPAGVVAPSKAHPIRWASDIQRQAFKYGKGPECLSGGWGAGKTWLCCQKALWLSSTYHHNRGVIARRVGKDLRATTQATFYKVCPPMLYNPRRGGRRNDQEGYLKLAGSGSEILFLHLDDPDTASIIKGLEINWFFIDQAEEDPDELEEVFDLLLGRLGRWDVAEVPESMLKKATAEHPWPYIHPESGKPVPPPYAMLAVNPDVEVHWVYRRFHEESIEHQTTYKARGYKMFHMPSEDNRFLGETNLKYLLDHDEAFIRRNVKGLWGLPEGAIHTIDKRSLVQGTPELLEYFRNHCTLYRGLDHGDSAPTCCLWAAVDRNGNVFIYREYYLPNALVSTHRGNIAALSEGERYDNNLADPSIFHQMPQKAGGRWSVADEYADTLEHPRETALFWTAADNNELGTRNRINEHLRVDPDRVHPIDLTMGSPKLFFVTPGDNYPQGCYHVLRETRSQRRVKIGTDMGRAVFSDERDPDLPDHAYDVLRYIIASRPSAPAPVGTQVEGSFFQAQRRLAKLNRKRGGV